MKHQKHRKLIKPNWGQWGRNEWSIVGGKCSEIQSLSKSLIQIMTDIKTLYIDADHKSADESIGLEQDTYTDKIGYYEWASRQELNKFTLRPTLAQYNLIITNGNHHRAQRQIVIIDSDKKASLKKRLDQLTHVDLILMHPNRNNESFEFLEDHLADSDQKPLRLTLNDHKAIAQYIKGNIDIAPLKALLLVGGKSQRMGEDKAKIEYHGKPQYHHAYDMLSSKVNEVYISCRKSQVADYPDHNTIADTFEDLGPLGGILSAMRSDPNAAWIVIACDLPMLSEATIDQLIDERDPLAAGTAFQSTYSEWMEPLISIYEPSIYPIALQLLGQGYSCARKVMINAPTKIIAAKDTNWLTNVNTPEERSTYLQNR